MVVCDKCGKEIVNKKDSFSAGYGTNKKGEKVCYACCAEEDKQWMRDNDKIALYLTIPDKPNYSLAKVSNWPGSLVFENVHWTKGRHNIAGVRYDCWFWFEGVEWWGVCYGDNTQILHCKKTKNRQKACKII